MTLVVALKTPGGLVLAADSRGTIGDPRGTTAINDDQDKLMQLSPRCGAGIAGSSEIGRTLVASASQGLGTAGDNVSAIAQALHSSLRGSYEAWYGKRPWVASAPLVDMRPVTMWVLAGYAGDAPHIYTINSQDDFVPRAHDDSALAGVVQYAFYLKHRLYDRAMSLDAGKALAAYLIAETATQDPKVGGRIKIATIAAAVGYTLLETEEVDLIVRDNEKQSAELRRWFFERGAVGAAPVG
jgi:20S proteasome alpha/beta subunit